MKPSDQVPSAAEFGLLRAFLASSGHAPSWIASAVGVTPAGRPRAQINNDLIADLKVLPKA